MPQDYASLVIRSSGILTGSYVAAAVVGIDSLTTLNQERNQLIILVDFTIGSLTTAEIKFEFSHNGTDFYQETFGTIVTGTESDYLGLHQIGATGLYRIPVQTKDRFIKVSAKGTGTATGSLLALTAIVGVA